MIDSIKYEDIQERLANTRLTSGLEKTHGRLIARPPSEYTYPTPTNQREFKKLLKTMSARPRWVCGLVAAELMLPFTEEARPIADTAFDIAWLRYFGKIRKDRLFERSRELFGHLDLDQRPEDIARGVGSEFTRIHEENTLPDYSWFAMIALRNAIQMTGKEYVFIEKLMRCAVAVPSLHAKRDRNDFQSIHDGRSYDLALSNHDDLVEQRFYAHWWDSCMRYIEFDKPGNSKVLEDELHNPVYPFVVE